MEEPKCPKHPKAAVIKYVNKGVRMPATWACLKCGAQLGTGPRDKSTVVISHSGK